MPGFTPSQAMRIRPAIGCVIVDATGSSRTVSPTLVVSSNPDDIRSIARFSAETGWGPRGSGIRVMPTSLAAQWAALEEHFRCHAKLVTRFRETGREAVVEMWENQINEGGAPLSEFEREALIERYCELFGTWPACAERAVVPDRRIAEGRHRIAHRRRRLTDRERLGSDIRLSERVLLNFESTFQPMVGYAGHDRKSLGPRPELNG